MLFVLVKVCSKSLFWFRIILDIGRLDVFGGSGKVWKLFMVVSLVLLSVMVVVRLRFIVMFRIFGCFCFISCLVMGCFLLGWFEDCEVVSFCYCLLVWVVYVFY